MSYITESPGDDVDLLGNQEGPYKYIRQLFLELGVMCVPDPKHGFLGDPASEQRALEIVEKVGARKRTELVLKVEKETRTRERGKAWNKFLENCGNDFFSSVYYLLRRHAEIFFGSPQRRTSGTV